ncbi:MAG: response regulator [Burkholderiaceae bacterium]|nr:response regulator [Burkholderiaceae bacterium]
MTVQYQDDYLVLNLYQVETEYLRLREQWAEEARGAEPGSPDLKLRYEIFVSRMQLLENERAQRLLAQVDPAHQAIRAIHDFTGRADLWLGDSARGRLSAEAAQALLLQLQALDAPIRRMMHAATHSVAQQVTERQEKVRQHNRIGLALTGFLLVTLLLLALLALRQMRKIDSHRLRLQALADELREARIEAENANAAKSDFLADMSHELRTPLHGLLGMLSLVKDGPRDARAAEWLAVADDSAQHLLRLLDDILDLSKLESGMLRLTPQPLHLPTLLREVHALLQPAAQVKGLTLRVEIAPGLPTHLMLDPTRLRQVLYNLLANAIKFSDSGSIVLRCSRLADDDPGPGGQGGQGGPSSPRGPRLAFEVADSGIGMDQATLARLFRRYGRGDSGGVGAGRHGGTGLGLAISRNLARLMGGEIVVRSAPGDGSVFSFHCPLVTAAPQAVAQTLLPPPPLRSLRVLVAEDHPVNRLYMAALLERLGHSARFVDHGLDALTALREEPFDIVLMDVHMPVMDGVAATEALRAMPAPANATPVVALTADVFADTRERCLRAGVTEVLAKPLSLAMLQALFARHFGTGTQLPPEPALVEAGAGGAAPSLLDRAALRSVRELMGAERLPSLFNGFFEQAGDAARRMHEALRDADPEALRRSAHAVKGAALNLGLPALAERAALLSREATALGASALALAVQRFDETLAATRALCVSEGLVSQAEAGSALTQPGSD